MQTTTFSAPDIVCGGCVSSIQRALGGIPGVQNVQVDIEAKTVTVTHDPGQVPRESLADALDDAGFSVAA